MQFTDHNFITQSITLSDYTDYEFSKKTGNCKVIYSADKEILFTIWWDQPFFLIATCKDNLELILEQNLFEGFVCDEENDGDWAFGKEELQHLLELNKEFFQKITEQRNNGKIE